MQQISEAEMKQHGYFLGPCSFTAVDTLLPIFSQGKVSACNSDILYPSQFYFNFEEHEYYYEDATPKNWEGKENILYWRGSTSGGQSSSTTDYKNFHRQRLVSHYNEPGIISKLNQISPLQVDVGFSKTLQCDEEECLKYTLLQPKDMSHITSVKYLLDIDGNSFSQRALPFFRGSGSLVFRTMLFDDWVMDKVEDGKHYLKVALNFSNMEDQFKKATTGDEGFLIAREAQLYAREHLRLADMQCYMYRLLLEYWELLEK
jgi:Glycosyl transferase family 90